MEDETQVEDTKTSQIDIEGPENTRDENIVSKEKSGEGVQKGDGEALQDEQMEVEHEGEQHADKEHLEGEHVERADIKEEHAEVEHVEGEHVEREYLEGGKVEGEQVEGEQVEGEQVEKEHAEGEHAEGEYAEGEHAEGEHVEGEHTEGEHAEGEHGEEKHIEGEPFAEEKVEGEDLINEEIDGEEAKAEETEEKTDEPKPPIDEHVEEVEGFVEEPPPDPAAPFDFSDSKEALKEPFELRPDQIAEVELLWEVYQNYTPAYSDIDGYVTEKELFYMLKSLMLMTYTPEQFQELIAYCVRPPHPEGHISYEQFLKMVLLRQRDFPIEDELRSALQVFDPGRTGSMDREYLKDVLFKLGHQMPQKQLNNLMKEVDMSNDGTIGIEDVVGTMCIDLNKEDLIMLMNSIFPPAEPPPTDDI